MALVLENIHKSYGKRKIVNRVNLQVLPGEIVGLLGPNGAGKNHHFLYRYWSSQAQRRYGHA